MRAGIFSAALALLLAPLGGDLRAAPLDAQGCAKLKEEQGQLEQSGVRGSMAKGPEWAKTNLPGDKLEQIRRLIDIDAQLVFRCHGKPLVQLPPEIEADPAAVKEGATAPKPGVAAPEKKKRPAPAAKKAAASPADGPAAAAPTPPPAPRKAAVAPKAPTAANQQPDTPGQPAAAKAAKPKPKAKASAIDPIQPVPNP